MFLVILLTLLPILYIAIRSKKNMQIFQQNFYNENNRYIKWGIKNKRKVFKILDLILLIVNIINIFLENKYLILINVIYIILFFTEYSILNNDQIKIPLKITSRVKRMFVTMGIIYLIPLLIYIMNNNIYLYISLYSLLISLNFFVIFISNVINKPIEKYVFWYYKSKAVNKIKNMPGLEVIGITGSYGKTSSKNILNDILNVKYNSITTPQNFNTQYGLIITINNYLNKFHDIFVAEMGAFKLGRIKLLCNLVRPKYGIITKIGEAHLETFGSRENIQKGKFELIESLPSNGLGILNIDDPMQTSYKIKNNVKIIWIGIDNKDADVLAENIKMDSNGMSFDVYFKESKERHRFTTKLLGTSNIYNILAALAFGYYKGMTLQELEIGVKRISAIEHRLELKPFNEKMTIIDDAYNSNPVGSKMALDVLDLMNGYKIVVTPGMIELGSEQYELNKKFGEYISDVADYVILVGKKQTKPIMDGLQEKKYNLDNIIVINDVKEAFKIIDELNVKNKHKYVLLENDLPDIFNEKKKEGN